MQSNMTAKQVQYMASAYRSAGASSSRALATVAPSLPSDPSSSKPAIPAPPLRVSLILSRQPLLRRTPHSLEATYHSHSQALRLAMSNPVPEDFYYSKGSLNHRRYQNAAYERTFDTFGPDLAGKAPDKSDIPSERPLQTFDRDYWAKEDSSRGLRSLERCPEDELFCILQRKDKKWGLPETMMEEGESLHSAVQRGIVGPGAALDGGAIDTWLITKKPVGTIQQGDVRTFFMRSHILAGEPSLANTSTWSTWAWLTTTEVERTLLEQGDARIWQTLAPVFGALPNEPKRSNEATVA